MTAHQVLVEGAKDRPVRVLHVINSLSGSGGAEQGMVRELVCFSPESTHLVVRLYEPDRLEQVLTRAGIESVCLDLSSASSGWNWPVGAARLLQVVDRFGPDVIHTSLASANLIGQIAGGRRSIPVLSTFTLSGDRVLMRRYQPGAASWKASVMRRVERVSARKDHVWFRALTMDAKLTNAEATGLDPDRVVVIPRGVPMPDTTMTPSRSDLGLPDDRPLILNVGRQTAQKGQGDLIRAFAKVRSVRAAHLVILGREGDGTRVLRSSMAEAGVDEDITIIPYTERPYDYYRAADVFAFSSHMEGLGTAVLEAMACGLPIAAYDIPPVHEITRGSSYASLVPVGQAHLLAGRIIDILDDPQSAIERARAARECVIANHSVENVARRLEARLLELSGHNSEADHR